MIILVLGFHVFLVQINSVNVLAIPKCSMDRHVSTWTNHAMDA